MTPATPEFALTLERTLTVSRAAVWRCWTEPDLLCQWFCPKPWGVSHAVIEMQTGGRFFTHMVGPNGEQAPNAGVFLQVDPGSKLVFTDAFVSAWVPSGKAFMVGEITLADAPGGGTHYRARALHWSEADMQQHEAMGFHAGWAAATQQLQDLAATL
jgi:uncharacterized protein YndB with AHSA1/START domain